MMKTISLEFDGYWREPTKTGVPAQSGIYCVYAGTRNIEENTVTINRLLYIGESADVRERLQNHKRIKDWTKKLSSGEVLCYTFAPVSSDDRERAEAALIFVHQPPTNEEHTTQFIYNDTEILVSGKIGINKLKKKFTVHKDDKL